MTHPHIAASLRWFVVFSALTSVHGCSSKSGAGSATRSTSGGQANGSAGTAAQPDLDLDDTLDPGAPSDGPCRGLACAVPQCSAGTTTSISGKVYDPAGKTPLYNVAVYVPNGAVPAFTEGASCDRCGSSIVGPVTAAITDENGAFKLENAPAGTDIPLVIQVGKWRRQLKIPSVAACADTALTDPQVTRLPRNKAEGDLPRIAIAAGSADQMECLPRRLGIDDAEFTNAAGDGRVHLYTGHHRTGRNGGGDVPITRFADTLNGGAELTSADELWGSSESLMKYDIVILSCEGNAYANDKPMPMRQAMYDYASRGGRVFASHLHAVWFAEGPDPVPTTGTWRERQDPTPNGEPLPATINQTFPKGQALANWLVNVGATTTPGQMMLSFPRDTLQAVEPTLAREWITLDSPEYPQSPKSVQYMSFNAPLGVPEDQVCGRAVYTDLHVASVDQTGEQPPFPSGCEVRDLSAQEKAVAFMLFDLSSCVQSDDRPPVVPK